MARLVVTEFVSTRRRDGERQAASLASSTSGWVGQFADTGQFAYKLDEALAHEALLLGRRTDQSFAGAWPARAARSADKMNAMPKYVASTTLDPLPSWTNTTVMEGDTAGAVASLEE